MDKLYLALIPFIYLLQMTLTILSVAMFLLPTPGNLGKAIRRGAPWMAIIILHTTSLSIQYFTIQTIEVSAILKDLAKESVAELAEVEEAGDKDGAKNPPTKY